ncbi:MAG: hypothetical protein EZS28_020280 [Streblomastix strix]|uniref:Uncharacterized protein n=1 Tax=Streblomastix strix TaxID=222440 RepID=A0A5J4VP93_9EUKA|nr:MAG: hypothetical protein EZS28_020280 [Streblomastix strix]
MKALQYACSDQYEITLLDNVHYEYVGIYQLTNILIPVTIKGGAQDDNKQSIRTTMMINSSQPYIIFLYEGTLSLFNLEFNFTVGIDQNLTKQILPEFSIIGTSKSAELFKSLLIGSCVINGLPDIAVSMMIRDPRAGIICPAYCTKGQVTSECICDTNSSDFTIQQCQKEKLCISELIHQTVADCKCLSSGDPRAGSTCPAYCIKGSTNQSCICDTNATNFPIDQCQKEKACKYDLINQTATDCPCLNSSDPRAGDTCASYCVKDKTTTECVCDTNVIDYSVEQCQQEQACKYDLIHQTTYYCPCLSTGDPRAGGICPSYCTAKDIPNQNCVCDSNPNAQYPPQTCQSEKQCNVSSNSSVPTDSCTCSKQNYPSGCKCPTNSSELYGIPSSRCECHTTSDPRSGTVCPAYCVKGSLTPDCVCDTNLSSYSSSQCMKDKLCIFKLQQQSKEYCPCLMKGDPRAGGICPSYCKSKAELTVNCMCELDSSYPQATCERDKLCIVDLIHQSTTNCPCLAINDPRGESICKQTDIDPSDPDQTDPIIPDPSEKYPETEQEQEEIIKQEDDEDKQKEESTSFQMNWIIYIVGGALREKA